MKFIISLFKLILLSVFLSLSFSAYAYDSVDIAIEQYGKKYVWGDQGPDMFDCSGLTQYVYGHVGIDLDRRSVYQSTYGIPVSKSELRRGDLVFFANDADDLANQIVGHVGIVVSQDKMINAVWDRKVEYDNLFSGWPNDLFLYAKRINAPGPSTKFEVGDSVEITVDDVIVRDLHRDWKKAGTKSDGSKGSVNALPIYSNGYWRWKINFDSGIDGWVAENYLKKASTGGGGTMSSLCLERLSEAQTAWQIHFPNSPLIMLSVGTNSTCNTNSCVNATIDMFSDLGISAGLNHWSLEQGDYDNKDYSSDFYLSGCVAFRPDIFEGMGLSGRGDFEAACIADFLGNSFWKGENCALDGFPIPAVLD
ncbi:MAG: C40 family peptidase [gamma proteobacterium symbiont of Lucinoma myriamae]|nr:C40 family peptidase [gamma proteobacterium symbiont of Lucinoma myriamae]MCU7819624.1 C40 family peptidase [gamma proteobacterium symbiont of Lucinoma myriamae]